MSCCLPCVGKSHTNKKTMSLKRKALILVNYDRARHTFTSLGAYLVLRETRDGLIFFIEMITTGGFLHQAGVKHGDRLVSVNAADVDGLDFDSLLDAIKSLMPLMFEIKRDGTPIVCVLDIAVGADLNPMTTFIGIYWNTTVDTVRPFIPLVIESLNTYRYVDKEEEVTLKTTVDGQDRWLSVEGSSILYTTVRSALSLFTKYRYVQDEDPDGKTPVIFTPTAEPDQCLSANTSNILKLESFDKDQYTDRSQQIPSNARFFFQESSDDTRVVFESTTVEGQYIGRDESNDDAVMSTEATVFDPPRQRGKNETE